LDTIDGWHKEDIAGNLLTNDRLSGALLQTQSFRGTICSVGAFDYLVRKINNQLSPEVKAAEDAQVHMREALIPLMKMLTPEDFELLVELIFSSSGWQRLGSTGKTKKTVDIELLMPVTGERAFVQVKSTANRQTLDAYVEELEKHRDAGAYSKMFFAWHDGEIDVDEADYPNVTLLDAERLAEMCLDTGLSAWLIEKSGYIA